MKNKGKFTMPPLMVPVIKVVGNFCNLRCRYCFYAGIDQSTPRVMSDELTEKFISEYMRLFSGDLTFIWHGGEPLLAGINFFEKVVNFQKKNLRKNHVIYNAIQTNATLINEEWAKFFKSHNFYVGVSLDGNIMSHNRFRRKHDNQGTFNAVMRGIKILRQYGIEPGIIQTLTRSSSDRAKENFEFFVNVLGIKNWSINIYSNADQNNRNMSDQNVRNENLVSTLKDYIDLWLDKDDPSLRIREIESFICGVVGKQAFTCEFDGTCGRFFCVESDGKIYPCDRLCDQEFLIGDLTRESLSEILKGPRQINYVSNVTSRPSDCEKCEWLMACNNGCPYHRVNRPTGKYYYCEARKEVFNYVRQIIEIYQKKGGIGYEWNRSAERNA